MKQIIFEGTNYAPRVELNPDGEIKMQGRCIIEDSVAFFNPIFRWVKTCTFNTVKVEIKLEYINTSSVKQIFTLISLIKENYSIKNVYVHWFYEEGDDDHFEVGKAMESQLNLPFDFFEYSEAV